MYKAIANSMFLAISSIIYYALSSSVLSIDNYACSILLTC